MTEQIKADMVAWPFNIANPVRAVHFALEPDCPYGDPTKCPQEGDARRAIEAYRRWLAENGSGVSS